MHEHPDAEVAGTLREILAELCKITASLERSREAANACDACGAALEHDPVGIYCPSPACSVQRIFR